jgi:hypothetical protein
VDVSVVVHDENIFHANILVFQQRLAEASHDLVEVLIALETFEAERNAGHDGLFLLDDHAGVGADRSQVEVVLNAKGETQHKRKQQQEPRSETLYLGRESHGN